LVEVVLEVRGGDPQEGIEAAASSVEARLSESEPASEAAGLAGRRRPEEAEAGEVCEAFHTAWLDRAAKPASKGWIRTSSAPSEVVRRPSMLVRVVKTDERSVEGSGAGGPPLPPKSDA